MVTYTKKKAVLNRARNSAKMKPKIKPKPNKIERDREATEQRLIDTIGKIVAENGFEKVGINAVAKQSDVSKILIYRYFGSVDGLMAAYIRQHDILTNLPLALPSRKELPAFLKKLYQTQIKQLRSNPTLRRLYRWELSSNNEMVAEIREQREKLGRELTVKVSKLTGLPKKEVEVMAAIISASITYLVMLEEFYPHYNGIAINKNSGWKQISKGIDALIDKILKNV
jgi:AcrR family transcriptional regulator